jgi:hypothetical protein
VERHSIGGVRTNGSEPIAAIQSAVYAGNWRLALPHEDERMNECSEPRLQLSPANVIAGEFVTKTFDYEDGRQVTVYLPPVPPQSIVFAGDGQMISRWGRFLEAEDVPSTMIVGVHRAADDTLRLHEYSPKFNPERFAAH